MQLVKGGRYKKGFNLSYDMGFSFIVHNCIAGDIRFASAFEKVYGLCYS